MGLGDEINDNIVDLKERLKRYVSHDRVRRYKKPDIFLGGEVEHKSEIRKTFVQLYKLLFLVDGGYTPDNALEAALDAVDEIYLHGRSGEDSD